MIIKQYFAFCIDVQWYLQDPNGKQSPLPKHACRTIEKGYICFETNLNVKPMLGKRYTISYGDPVTRIDTDGTVTVLIRGMIYPFTWHKMYFHCNHMFFVFFVRFAL